jgi:DNA-binding SARP family transcriptional activator
MSVTEEFTPETAAAGGVFVFGAVRAPERSGESVALPRLALALVAYLLLDRPDRRAWREDIGAFLWERVDRTRQAGNLRQLLFRIRAAEIAGGVELIETPGAEIALSANHAPIDLRNFQASVAERDAAAACATYGGDLLAGLTARGERLNAWLANKRAGLRREFLAVVTPVVEAQANGPVGEAAVVAAKRILEIDPRREIAYLALIRASEERGDQVGAAHYRRQRDRAIDSRLPTRAPSSSNVLFGERITPWLAPINGLAAPATAPALDPAPLIGPVGQAPRAIVSAHAPSYASPAGRELVDELGADLAIRLAQTRALIVLAAGAPSSGDGAEGADYLIEVRLAQGRADAAQLRLLALPSRQILWASSFADGGQYSERALITLFSILRHIEEREVSLKGGPDSERFAYRVTLEAQRLLNGIDLPSIRRARRLLRSAQAVAPEFVPTIAALARSHVMEWLVRAPFEVGPLEIAELFAKQAIALSPDDHRGYHELGLVRVYRRRLDEGIECLNRAVSLSPDDKGVRADLADALVFNGQSREAIAMLGDMVRSFDPDDDYIRWVLAGAHFAREDYESSLRQVREMNNPSPAFRISAAAHALNGDVASARRIMRESMDFNPDFDLKAWLAIAPCRNKDFMQRYTEGLRLAGFD